MEWHPLKTSMGLLWNIPSDSPVLGTPDYAKTGVHTKGKTGWAFCFSLFNIQCWIYSGVIFFFVCAKLKVCSKKMCFCTRHFLWHLTGYQSHDLLLLLCSTVLCFHLTGLSPDWWTIFLGAHRHLGEHIFFTWTGDHRIRKWGWM